jgi:2-oxoisovalerate dehydrogenase E1 component
MTTASAIETTETIDVGFEPYSRAYLVRAFEQRLLRLFSEGKLFGTVHTCIGQEFTGVAVASHLRSGDLIFSNHRCHGHYLARTGDAQGLMAEVMGRVSGICNGRGGSQHICSDGVFSNGIQGGIVPVSAGLALAQKQTGTGNVVVVFIGDGTLGEGVVYETMNIASKWDLPLLIVLENNKVSQSTKQSETLAGDIRLRAEAFGIRTFKGETWAPEELIDTVGHALEVVRGESRPVFVEIDTYRLMAHSKGDDDRPKEELERFWELDPLTKFAGSHPDLASKLLAAAEQKVTDAVERASEDPLTAFEAVIGSDRSSTRWTPTKIEGRERVVTRIYEALRQQLEGDERSILIGEDIEGPYGGAFKVTKDLSLKYPGRVRNTPISEAAIVGMGNGLAIAGMLPVCEIMFGDFLTLAMDQWVNHAAKFRWMYNDQVSVPLIIRTPMGGRRGYGATHSQSLEKHFLGLPGTQVLAIHGRYDPYLFYKRLFEVVDRPTLVIENKVLYGEYVTHETVQGFWCEHTDDDFPTTRIRSVGRADVTILCYGGMLSEAEKALDVLFEEHEIVAEIVCPTQIYPLHLDPIVAAVRESQRVLVVEEGQMFCGFGAEVVASICEACPDLAIRIRRLGAAARPLPSSKPAELESLPGTKAIVSKCLELVQHD